MKKFKREEILIVILSLLASFMFLGFHTVPDTYNAMNDRMNYSEVFIDDIRPVSALFMTLGEKLHMSVVFQDIISNICAFIFGILAISLLFQYIVKDEEKSNLKTIIYAIGCFLAYYNLFSIEHLAYLETSVICLGKFFAIITSINLSKGKRLKSATFLILALLCYQGIFDIFITTSIFLLIYFSKDKQEIKKSLAAFAIDIIVTIVYFVVIMIIGKFLINVTKKSNIDIKSSFSNFKYFPKVFNSMLDKKWVLPKIFNLYFVTIIDSIVIILINGEKRLKNILKYLLFIGSNILVCLAIIFLLYKSKGYDIRVITSIGEITGLSLIIIYNERTKFFSCIFTLLVTALTLFNYIAIGIQSQKTTRYEIDYGNSIKSEIERYENASGIKVDRIYYYYDSKNLKTYNNYENNTYTVKSIYCDYAVKGYLQYFAGRDVYVKKYEGENINNWDVFSEEQFKFEGDTLILAIY